MIKSRKKNKKKPGKKDEKEENNDKKQPIVYKNSHEACAVYPFALPIEQDTRRRGPNSQSLRTTTSLLGRLVRSFSDLMDPYNVHFNPGYRRGSVNSNNSSSSSARNANNMRPMSLAKD